MHDEKYSPRGWYLYIIPMDKDTIKVMNCCSKPHAKKVRKLLYKAVEERPVLRDIIDGAKPTGTERTTSLLDEGYIFQIIQHRRLNSIAVI